jgi:hypothetical protein
MGGPAPSSRPAPFQPTPQQANIAPPYVGDEIGYNPYLRSRGASMGRFANPVGADVPSGMNYGSPRITPLRGF